MSNNSAPGFKEYPEHGITTKPADVRVTVTFQGEVIADTRDAVQMQEAMGSGKSTVAPVVYYIPRTDVKMERLVRTSHHTYCPFKGEASYFSLKDGPENAVWSYERPYDGGYAQRLACFLPRQGRFDRHATEALIPRTAAYVLRSAMSVAIAGAAAMSARREKKVLLVSSQ